MTAHQVFLSTLVCIACSISRPAEALVVGYTQAEFLSMPSNVQTASLQAGQRISILFNDPVNVNIRLKYAPLSGGAIAQASSFSESYDYSSVRSALARPRLLQNGSSFRYLGDAAGSVLTSSVVKVNTATAKALGLMPNNNNLVDAQITFNSNYSFDFNPNDGVASGNFDYVGVLMHEIGHAMGFVSSADSLDVGGSRTNPTLQDLFRFSDLSISRGHQFGLDLMPDIAADARNKYFLDPKLTPKGETLDQIAYSTGKNRGDGRQNSHWKDNQGNGVMDPTAGMGENTHTFSGYDVEFFDTIGWDVQRIFDKAGNAFPPLPGRLQNFMVCGAAVSDLDCPALTVPEPRTIGMLGVGLVVLFGVYARRKPL